MLKRMIEIECTAEELEKIEAKTPREKAQYIYSSILLAELVRDMKAAGCTFDQEE